MTGRGVIAMCAWVLPVLAACAGRQVCDPESLDPWVAAMRARVLAHDELARHAIATFGEPVGCTGEQGPDFDGNEFGSLQLRFARGTIYRLETQPPEAAITTLASPDGFPDEAAVRGVLRDYVDGIGFAIDWTRPDTLLEESRTIERFDSDEPGSNASAAFVTEDGTLIEVRFSFAL